MREASIRLTSVVSLGKLLKTLAIEQPELVGKEQFVFELAC